MRYAIAGMLILFAASCPAQDEESSAPKTDKEVWTALAATDKYCLDKSQPKPGGPGLAVEKIRDPKLTPVLAYALRTPHSWMAKISCVLALGNIETPESTEALRSFLKSTALLVITEDADAEKTGIRDMVDRWMYVGSIQSAGKCLVARGEIRAIKEDMKRLGLIHEMVPAGKPGLEAIIEYAREMAGGAHENTGEGQVQLAIEKFRADDCRELLRKAALEEGLPEYARHGALNALAEGWGADEYPTIIAVAKASIAAGESARHRNFAMSAYGRAAKVNPELTREELLLLMQDKSPYLPCQAAAILGPIGKPEDIPEFERLLGNVDRYGENNGLLILKGLWHLEYKPREVTWMTRRIEKEYQKYMESNPKPKDDAKTANP